jgi:hypothetical protein
MCEVIGVSVMAEIHYNSQKWSNGELLLDKSVSADTNRSP